MIIINHKSNLNIDEIIEYEKNIRDMDVIIMPTLCYLPIFKGGKYKLGSQDISEFKEKARTGEINGDQLKSMNVKYNMIGHSERRRYNEESDETMTIKFKNCYDVGIIPVYCIGANIEHEIDMAFNAVHEEIIFAYEPLENIGNKKPNLDFVEKRMEYIKEYILNKYNKKIKLLYGGGVSIENIDEILEMKSQDGILVSSDALNIEHLRILYKKCKDKELLN